jgi:hypothetical protein
MPEHSLVVLSGQDDLVPAHHVHALVTEETRARLLVAPEERHAAFLFNLEWQQAVIGGVWDLLASLPRPAAGQAGAAATVAVTAGGESSGLSSPSASASLPGSPPGSACSGGGRAAAPPRGRGVHGHSDSALSLALSGSFGAADLLMGGLSAGGSRSGSDAGDGLAGLDPLLLDPTATAAAGAARLRGKGAAGGPPPPVRCDSAREALRLKGE